MDDLISRQAAIEAINRICPVDTEYDCTLLDRVDVRYVLEDLPSAQPRGKWIYHIDDLFPAESTKECDQCHAEQPLICDDEFCPHCGAKMEVTE